MTALRKALEDISRLPGCGCSPCVGQCTSREALLIELEEIRDIAREALANEPKEEPLSTSYETVASTGLPHTSFPTGSRRDNRVGKGRFDLISPIVLNRDAKHLENGAAKYGDRNWEKGQPLMTYFDSAMRHLVRYQEGHRDEDHLAAARWNIACMIHTEEMVKRGVLPRELDDTVKYLRDVPPPSPKPRKVPGTDVIVPEQFDGKRVFYDPDSDVFPWAVELEPNKIAWSSGKTPLPAKIYSYWTVEQIYHEWPHLVEVPL